MSTENTSTPRRCRKARKRPIPFDCKLGSGHEGDCSPYTLPPMTREQWENLAVTVEYQESPDSAPLKDFILAALFPSDPPGAVR